MNAIAHPPDAIQAIDAITAVTSADPYPFYARLRDGPPLVFDPALKLWVASRADVLREIFANSALRVRPPAEPVPRAFAGTPAGELFGQLVRMNDGAPHAAQRPVLQRLIGGIDLAVARDTVHRIARQGPMAGAPLDERLFGLPVASVALWLGFDLRELPQVVHWVRDFVACLSPLSNPAQLVQAAEAAEALLRRFEALAAARPAAPGSALARLQAESSEPPSRAL